MELTEITSRLNPLNPVSVILYGSRARTDAMERSDYEVGALFRNADNVTFPKVKSAIDLPGVNVYPFAYEDFLDGRFDTPFQENIYRRELIVAGKTIGGEKVIENMAPPNITIQDALEDICFRSGGALDAFQNIREGHQKMGGLMFYKTMLFATRDLVMLELGEFPTTYDGILQEGRKLDLGIHTDLVEKAYDLRINPGELSIERAVQGVTYVNDHVKRLIRDKWKANRDLIIVS